MKLFFPILLFSLIFESCKHVKDPEFRKVENLRLKSVGFQQVVIGFNVTYYNPNNFGVSVKEAEINVSIDSIYLGRFTQDEPVIVKSTTDFTIPFSGSIPYPTALKLNLQDMVERTIFIKADGSIKVGKAGVYITKPIQYSGNHRLDEITIPVK